MENPLALSIAIATKNLNAAIMEAAKNGLVVQVEPVINEVSFDGGRTSSSVPEIIISVLKDLTVDLK